MSKFVIAFVFVIASVGMTTPASAQDECRGETAMICGFVWDDANHNGIQDLGETGIEGVEVTLSDGSDTFVLHTDPSGFFTFSEDLDAGDYTLSVATPSIGTNTTASPTDAGTDDALDSDGTTAATGSVITFHLDAAQKLDVDFGFYPQQAQSIGTGTPGYWKNHPEAWPAKITIGGREYDRDTAIYWLKKVGKDKTTTMFSSLVSAKLNVMMGNKSYCVDGTIAAADGWMAEYGPVGSGVLASSPAWSEGEPLHKMLDDYNNGRLCAPHRN
jgi:SdrD B-like protein